MGFLLVCVSCVLIELIDVFVFYNDKVVFFEVFLCFIECCIGVIGSNGSGKSIFVWFLNGLLLLDCGMVIVDGLDIKI